MKKVILTLLLLLASVQTFASFNDWFTDKTLRIDYYHTGNSKNEIYSIDHVRSEPYWGGSHINLIDTLNSGAYYFKAFDVRTNTLIYSRGFCALYDEWQFTEEAKHTSRTFTETVVMPFHQKNR